MSKVFLYLFINETTLVHGMQSVARGIPGV